MISKRWVIFEAAVEHPQRQFNHHNLMDIFVEKPEIGKSIITPQKPGIASQEVVNRIDLVLKSTCCIPVDEHGGINVTVVYLISEDIHCGVTNFKVEKRLKGSFTCIVNDKDDCCLLVTNQSRHMKS